MSSSAKKRITISRKRFFRLLEIEQAYLALKEKSNQTWSQEEDDYLIVAYKDGESSLEDLSLFLGRTKAAVANRVSYLRQSRQLPSKMGGWSDEDISFLRRFHGKMTCQEIAEKLGRTERAVWHKVSHLGIGRQKQIDVEEIKRLALQGLTRHEIANRLGCHYDTIKRLVSKYGIEVTPANNLFKSSHNDILSHAFRK